MIISIPDEVAAKYMKAFPERNPNTIATVFAKMIEAAIDAYAKNGEPKLTVTGDDFNAIKDIVGRVATGEELANKIRRIGTLKIQGREFVLSQEQMTRLKQEAFFHAKNGEPKSEKDATPAQAELIVNRYMDQQLQYWIGQMCSQI